MQLPDLDRVGHCSCFRLDRVNRNASEAAAKFCRWLAQRIRANRGHLRSGREMPLPTSCKPVVDANSTTFLSKTSKLPVYPQASSSFSPFKTAQASNSSKRETWIVLYEKDSCCQLYGSSGASTDLFLHN